MMTRPCRRGAAPDSRTTSARPGEWVHIRRRTRVCPCTSPTPPRRGRCQTSSSFFRWHLPDPVVFERNLRVTIQQIGAAMIPPGGHELRAAIDASGVVAGNGWTRLGDGPVEWLALCERVDDYCATAFVMCREVQTVPRVDVDVAIADVARFSYETPSPLERVLTDPPSL